MQTDRSTVFAGQSRSQDRSPPFLRRMPGDCVDHKIHKLSSESSSSKQVSAKYGYVYHSNLKVFRIPLNARLALTLPATIRRRGPFLDSPENFSGSKSHFLILRSAYSVKLIFFVL